MHCGGIANPFSVINATQRLKKGVVGFTLGMAFIHHVSKADYVQNCFGYRRFTSVSSV